MTDDISVSTTDGICEIRFQRAAKKNAITTAMYAALRDGLLAAEADTSVRVILFTADGDSFSAGNDLADFLASRDDGMNGPVYGFLNALATAGKPLVAAVNGLAIGVGATMLLHCDLIYAAPTARLIFPFVNLGIVPEAASTLLLPRTIGHQRTAELLMLGGPLDGETALNWGLINRIVPVTDSVAEVAAGAARALAAKAPNALRLTKALLKGDPAALIARIDVEGRHLEDQLASAEGMEGIKAMLEKRPPEFSKRGT